jgi:hypothetical protein
MHNVTRKPSYCNIGNATRSLTKQPTDKQTLTSTNSSVRPSLLFSNTAAVKVKGNVERKGFFEVTTAPKKTPGWLKVLIIVAAGACKSSSIYTQFAVVTPSILIEMVASMTKDFAHDSSLRSRD